MSSSNMNKISIKKGPSENTLTVTTKDPLEINVELPNQDTLLKLKKQKGIKGFFIMCLYFIFIFLF